jgi:hypothetical protein
MSEAKLLALFEFADSLKAGGRGATLACGVLYRKLF